MSLWPTGALFCLLGLLLLGGCADLPSRQGVDEAAVKSILPVADSPAMPAVIHSLLKKADGLYHQGKPQDAMSTLERAVRIKPQYPEIWSRMAFIYAATGQPRQAISTAQRAARYMHKNPALTPFNQSVIDSGGQLMPPGSEN